MDYMEKAWEVSKQVAAFYKEEKYTDKDGLVWLGIEGDTHEDCWLREDALVSMSPADMTKKMINELNDWDETPVEDPYEYNVETTDLITGHTHMLRTLWEPDTEWLERKKQVLDDNDRALLNAGGGALEYTRRLVKRRKAGRIEDV